MSDNVILLICVMLMPIIMIITGAVIWKFPSEYNGLGYSTPMSQKNPSTWRMAQLVGGRSFFFSFLAALPISIIVQSMPIIFHLSEETGGAVCLAVSCAQVLLLIVPITITERTLRRCFDKDGNPRQ